MRRRIAAVLGAATLALAGLAASPGQCGGPIPSPLGALASAEAAVSKSLSSGEGGANVSGAGERFGNLLSGWGVPVLIALGGLMLIGSLTQRNIGASVGIVVVVLVGLIFLVAPSAIETAAKAIANVVF